MGEEKIVSDIVKERIKNSIGLKAKLMMYNGYPIIGVLSKCDNSCVEVELDNDNGQKVVYLCDIREVTIYNNQGDSKKNG